MTKYRIHVSSRSSKKNPTTTYPEFSEVVEVSQPKELKSKITEILRDIGVLNKRIYGFRIEEYLF